MKKLILLLIIIFALHIQSSARSLPKFSYNDANGCIYEFQSESINGQDVTQSKYAFLNGLAQSPKHERDQILSYFYKNDDISRKVVLAILSSVADKGITREEYIAALQGHVVESVDQSQPSVSTSYTNTYQTPLQPKATISIQAIESGNFSLTDIVQQIPESQNVDIKNLIEQLRTYENNQKYAKAANTVTEIMKYSSTPLLYYVRAICYYKDKKYKKSLYDCLKASQDGRLPKEYLLNVYELSQVAGDRQIGKMEKRISTIETAGGVALQTIESAMEQATVQQAQTSTNMIDPSMANYQAQLQRIGQLAVANTQQGINRINKMFTDMSDWAFRFEKQNGRNPTEYEKTQWVRQYYPDLLDNYILSQGSQNSTSSNESSTSSDTSQNHGNSVDYKQWYKRTEDNLANLHRSFSTGSKVTTTSKGQIKDYSSTSGGTYLQMSQTYKNLQKELVRIRQEAAQNGIAITPSQWETAELKP